MAIEKVIVIDDEPVIRRSLELQLRGKRLSVALCSTIAEAERYIAKDSFDLMFVDVRLPDGDGTDLLNRLAPRAERPLIVVMTGYGTIESAVSCIRAGAFDYIIKPFSASQIDVILRKADNFNQAVRISQILAQESIDAAPLIGDGQASPADASNDSESRANRGDSFDLRRKRHWKRTGGNGNLPHQRPITIAIHQG